MVPQLYITVTLLGSERGAAQSTIGTKSFCLSCEDARDEDDWTLRIKRAICQPTFSWKLAMKMVYVHNVLFLTCLFSILVSVCSVQNTYSVHDSSSMGPDLQNILR